MQTTSATWDALWAAGATVERRVKIDGVEYTLMSDPVISRALMQNGMSVGNAVSAMCQLSVMTGDAIPRAAEVTVEVRLTDGVAESEWLPEGTFYISKRHRDPVTGLLSLECYDAMLKANAAIPEKLPWRTNTGAILTTNNGDPLFISSAFPRSPEKLLEDLLYVLGLELDSRTQIETGSIYAVSLNAGATIHDALSAIAAANGGNWIITPAGKLRLVPLTDAANAASAQTAVDVIGVTGAIGQRTTGTVTGVRYMASDIPVIVGDDTGLVVDAAVSAAVANDLYTKLVGMEYQAFALEGAIYSPAAELGDYIRAGANGEVSAVLCAETATLSALYGGSVSAPEAGEMSDEYPYIGGASAKALTAAKAYAEEAVAGFSASLDQEDIFNRLTNGGAEQGLLLYNGQVYLNASYIRAGTLVADFIKGGMLTLGGLNNANGQMQVLDGNGNVVGMWNNEGVTLNNGSLYFPVNNSIGAGYIAINRNGIPLASYFENNNGSCMIRFDNFAISVKNPGDASGQTGVAMLSDGIALSDNENDAGTRPIISLSGILSNLGVTLTPQGLRLTENGNMVGYFLTHGIQTNGNINAASLHVGNGASGTFTTADGKTVTVADGIITSIV